MTADESRLLKQRSTARTWGLVRFTRVHTVLCLVTGIVLGYNPSVDAIAQEPDDIANLQDVAEHKPSVEEIRSWIRDLSEQSYSKRQLAGIQIDKYLDIALPELITAARNERGEVSEYLIQYLALLAKDPNTNDGKQAYECLLEISGEGTTAKAIFAQKIIRSINELLREQTVEQLQSLDVQIGNRDIPVLTGFRNVRDLLYIGERFKGTAEDLDSLKWLGHIEFVKLEGSKINGEVLLQVVRMPRLRKLQISEANLSTKDLECLRDTPDLELLEFLYTPIDDSAIDLLAEVPVFGDVHLFGTKVSDEGRVRLIELMDTADVFVAKGGFLGVECDPNSVVVQRVVPGGPAESAGLRPGDRLLTVNKNAITIFEDLRKELSKSAPGQRVVIEYQRRTLNSPGERLEVSVALGKRENARRP